MEIDGPGLARDLFHAYLKQILLDGFLHADPHPGNVFITEDDQIALLDLGMIARVLPGLRDNILRLLLAIAEGRAKRQRKLRFAWVSQSPVLKRLNLPNALPSWSPRMRMQVLRGSTPARWCWR